MLDVGKIEETDVSLSLDHLLGLPDRLSALVGKDFVELVQSASFGLWDKPEYPGSADNAHHAEEDVGAEGSGSYKVGSAHSDRKVAGRNVSAKWKSRTSTLT